MTKTLVLFRTFAAFSLCWVAIPLSLVSAEESLPIPQTTLHDALHHACNTLFNTIESSTFSADSITIDPQTNAMTLLGHVQIQEETLTLQASSLFIKDGEIKAQNLLLELKEGCRSLKVGTCQETLKIHIKNLSGTKKSWSAEGLHIERSTPCYSPPLSNRLQSLKALHVERSPNGEIGLQEVQTTPCLKSHALLHSDQATIFSQKEAWEANPQILRSSQSSQNTQHSQKRSLNPSTLILLQKTSLLVGDSSLPLLSSEVASDRRATGFLAPRLSYSDFLGAVAKVPLFVRLGPSADLRLEAGWGSSWGGLFSVRLRHNTSPSSKGEVSLRTFWGISPRRPFLLLKGKGKMGLGEKFAAFYELDGSSDLRHKIPTMPKLLTLSRRYRRSRLSIVRESPRAHLGVAAEWLQSLPRSTQADAHHIRPDWLSPSREAVPAAHRQPHIQWGTLAELSQNLRSDFNVDYLLTQGHSQADFIDWGEGPERSALGIAGKSPAAAANNQQHDPTEPIKDAHHVELEAALSWTPQLNKYFHTDLSTRLLQQHTFARQDKPNKGQRGHSSLFLSAEISSTLERSYPSVIHLLEPRISWRSRAMDGGNDTLGGPTVWTWGAHKTPLQSVDFFLDNAWIAPNWRAKAWIGGALLKTEAGTDTGMDTDTAAKTAADFCELCAVLEAGAVWNSSGETLEGTLSWDGAAKRTSRGKLTGSIGLIEGWRVLLSQHYLAGNLTERRAPSRSTPASSWRLQESLSPWNTHLTQASIQREGLWGGRGSVAWVWTPNPDFEAQIGLYSLHKGWRIGLDTTRRATSPRWSATLNLTWSQEEEL